MTVMTGTVREYQRTVFIISRAVLRRLRNVSDISCRENQNSDFFFNKVFSSRNHAVYEIMWKNIVEPQLTIWRKHFSGWIPKATITHSEYVIIIAFPLQQLLYSSPHCYVIRTMPVLFPFLRFGVFVLFQNLYVPAKMPLGRLYLLKVKTISLDTL
jgi:hypothetical protein